MEPTYTERNTETDREENEDNTTAAGRKASATRALTALDYDSAAGQPRLRAAGGARGASADRAPRHIEDHTELHTKGKRDNDIKGLRRCDFRITPENKELEYGEQDFNDTDTTTDTTGISEQDFDEYQKEVLDAVHDHVRGAKRGARGHEMLKILGDKYAE